MKTCTEAERAYLDCAFGGKEGDCHDLKLKIIEESIERQMPGMLAEARQAYAAFRYALERWNNHFRQICKFAETNVRQCSGSGQIYKIVTGQEEY